MGLTVHFTGTMDANPSAARQEMIDALLDKIAELRLEELKIQAQELFDAQEVEFDGKSTEDYNSLSNWIDGLLENLQESSSSDPDLYLSHIYEKMQMLRNDEKRADDGPHGRIE